MGTKRRSRSTTRRRRYSSSEPEITHSRRYSSSSESDSSNDVVDEWRAEEALARRRYAVFVVLLVPVMAIFFIGLYMMYRSTKNDKSFKKWFNRSVFTRMLSIWMFHQLNFRQDPVGVLMFSNLPGASGIFLGIMSIYLKVARGISGYKLEHAVSLGPQGYFLFTMSSLAFFDQAILDSDVTNIVIMGGDMTTYPYQIEHSRNIYVVNRKEVQYSTKKLLKRAGVSTSKVAFVSVKKPVEQGSDYLDMLDLAGCDLSESTLFILDDQLASWKPELVFSLVEDINVLADEASEYRIAFSYLDESKVLGSQSIFSRLLRREKFLFGLPDDEQEEWISGFMEPVVHERIESEQCGFMLCSSIIT